MIKLLFKWFSIEFICEHLGWIVQAVENGTNCLGYHYWVTLNSN
ncbi:hypothetical protein [Thomasclavelia cocleata]|nr:hypothetical protein [Thomasclavelia cocleata]MCR1959920.1 hypothetical protein [Thomasclavelia cocleata]